MTEHDKAAREIARIYAAESEGIRDGCERAIELLCARVERETIERAAELLGKVRAIQEAKLSSLATEVDRAIAQAMIEALRISEDNIRALAEEASREA